jgi:hypothetical protein
MGGKKTPAGMGPQTFPRKVQLVALHQNKTDRFSQETNQRRRTLLTVLASPGGFALRASPILSLFAASLIFLAPTHALAQEENHSVAVRDRARPEYDPLGMRFGGFTLNASLDLTATYDDNIFAEDTDTNSDWILAASPHARLASNWSRHALAIEAGATLPSHRDFSGEDVNTGYGRLHGRFDVGVDTSITGDVGAAHEVESRLDPDRPPQGTPPVEYDTTNVGVGIQHTFNRFRVSASAMRNSYDYDGAQSFRDFDENTFTGRLEAEISPRIGLLLQATTDERDYNNAPGLNSDGQTYLVGATINFTDLMKGHIAVGQFSRDYDNGTSEDGLAVDTNLEWYLTRLTTLTFTASRNSEDTIGSTAAPYVQTAYGARIDHELLRNVILTAGVRAGTRDYDGIALKDEFTHVDVGADYLVSRRVALQARFNRDDLDSNGLNRDYEDNRFTVGVSLRL